MKTHKVITLMFIILAISGCQSMPFFSGESFAGPRLKKDTSRIIKIIAKAQGCNSIDHIETNVISHEKSNGIKGHVWGKEDWMIAGCSKYRVTFTEDGIGGTFFDISK